MDKDKPKKDYKEQVIAGIRVIESIVSKAVSSPSEILSGIKQILFFYRLLPDKWKQKAFWIFEKLWSKKKVVLSTEPEKAEQIYEVTFDDDKLKSLYASLPQNHQAIILQGKSMIDLIDRGLHSDSDNIKTTVEQKYGQFGLNIVNMLTTKDMQLLLKEIEDEKISDPKLLEKRFNEWALKYDSIALLVSPDSLSYGDTVKKNIIDIAKKKLKNYMILNLSGKMDDCVELIKLVGNLKKDKELNYKNFEQDISDSGFCKSLKIKIIFQN